MVGSIVPTSTWSHNCGMHVIADYMVEKINQDNFQEVFNGNAYDELLESFRTIYKQEDLTWEIIRESSMIASRINTQIIWGMALRFTLQKIIKSDVTYRENLAEQYLALLNLLIEEKYSEANKCYPILLVANLSYLFGMAFAAKGFRATQESQEAQDLENQFNENGFDRYCKTIMSIDENSDDLYHWLGISELTVICDYFEINPVINNDYEPSKLKKGPSLNFINEKGSHWERMITGNQPNMVTRLADDIFYQEYILKGNSHFIKNIDKIGQIFFSDEYLTLAVLQDAKLPTVTVDKKESLTQFKEMIGEFTQACVQGRQDDFCLLIEKYKSNISISGENDEDLLHYLALEYNNRNVQFLIKELANLKIDLNSVNNKGYTPLHYAAIKNNIFAIVELVRQGAIVDFVTPEGLSACHVSVIHNNKQAFVALKSVGASLTLEAYPNAINYLPCLWDLNVPITPIKIAEKQQEQIYEYLIKNNLVSHVGLKPSPSDLKPSSQKQDQIISVVSESKKEQSFTLSMTIKKLYEFYLKHKDNRELCLKVQDDFFLKSEIELSVLDDESLKIINIFYEESFPTWITRLVVFFESKKSDENACKNIEKIINNVSSYACKAILDGKENKVLDCIIIDYRCLFLSGKNSVLHYALKNDQYDFTREVIFNFLKCNYKGEVSPENLKKQLDQTFELASKKILDEYDRTLEFRLNRKKQYLFLKNKLKQAKTIAEKLKYQAMLSHHHAGNFNIFCVDKQHEKNKHTAKIQAKKISKWGPPFMLALRSAGELANGGVIRFGFEMARPYLPNVVQLPFTYVGGKVGSYLGDKMGYESAIAEEYTKMAISNAISFAIMPQYYVASTILGGAVYYAFKDSGYDNIEALCLLASERVALGATSKNSDDNQIKKGEAYEYQLNKNLAPIVGDYAAEYIAPVVTFVDNGTQKFDNVCSEQVAFLAENLSYYCSQSTLSSVGNAMNGMFSSPVEALQRMQQYSNSWVESGFNLVEGGALHYLMNDSKFKSERLHAIELYKTNQLQQSLAELKMQGDNENTILKEISSNLDKAQLTLTEMKNSFDDSLMAIQKQEAVVFNLKEQFDRQQLHVNKFNNSIMAQAEAVNKALDFTEELNQKTEGFVFQEKCKDAYAAYKYSLVKPNRSAQESQKLLKEAEQALVECKFHNTQAVNKMIDLWQKSLDELYARHSDNYPNWNDPAHVIGSIVNDGFSKFSDRNQLARFLADEIIRLKYPLYPEIGDQKIIEAERDLLIHEISTDELSGYKRKPHRVKNRLYDYFIAKVQNTEKKRHQHRWERSVKPIGNELAYKLVGWKPFKEFNGGDDGEAGRAGVQFNFNSDGSKSAQMTVNERPIAILYESEKSALQITAPERQAIMSAVPSNQASGNALGYTAQNTAASTSAVAENNEINSYSSLNSDNPYIQEFMAEQHTDLCETINKLGEERTEKDFKEKPVKSKAFESKAKPDLPKPQHENKPASVPLEEKRPEPVTFSKPNKPSDGWVNMLIRSYKGENSPEVSAWRRNNAQGAPQWFQFTQDMKEVSDPMEQVPRIVVKALGESAMILLEDNFSLDNFLKGQNVEGLMAEEKIRQQSYFMMAKFLGEETTRILAQEKPETIRYAEKFISNYYHSSQEDKLKGVVKISAAVLAHRFLNLQSTRLVGSAFGHISKSENNAVSLALQGPPKTFLPNYRHTPTPAVLLRHDQKINTTYLGEYNSHEALEKQGPIPDVNIKTFMGSTFKSYRLEQDIVLSRVGNSFEDLGQYFCFSRANGAFSDRIDRAILPKWPDAKGPNIVDTAYYIHIPKGTTIHVGKAAPQGGFFLGGTEQVFIREPWTIPGVSVVYRHPIKEAHLWNTKVMK